MDNIKFLRNQKEKIIADQEDVNEEVNKEPNKPVFRKVFLHLFHSKIDGSNKSDDKQTVNEKIAEDESGNDDNGSIER